MQIFNCRNNKDKCDKLPREEVEKILFAGSFSGAYPGDHLTRIREEDTQADVDNGQHHLDQDGPGLPELPVLAAVFTPIAVQPHNLFNSAATCLSHGELCNGHLS